MLGVTIKPITEFYAVIHYVECLYAESRDLNKLGHVGIHCMPRSFQWKDVTAYLARLVSYAHNMFIKSAKGDLETKGRYYKSFLGRKLCIFIIS
jgi:hypothetical protein